MSTLVAFGQDLVPVSSILANSVTNLHAEEETIWVGEYSEQKSH